MSNSPGPVARMSEAISGIPVVGPRMSLRSCGLRSCFVDFHFLLPVRLLVLCLPPAEMRGDGAPVQHRPVVVRRKQYQLDAKKVMRAAPQLEPYAVCYFI